MATNDAGAASGAAGEFERQDSAFREWVDRGVPGRYHLYVSAACPWCHRTMIVRELMGLEEVVGISYLDPIRDERGWAFTGGRFVDQVEGMAFLAEAYERTAPGYDGRVTAPALWDRGERRIVNNE